MQWISWRSPSCRDAGNTIVACHRCEDGQHLPTGAQSSGDSFRIFRTEVTKDVQALLVQGVLPRMLSCLPSWRGYRSRFVPMADASAKLAQNNPKTVPRTTAVLTGPGNSDVNNSVVRIALQMEETVVKAIISALVCLVGCGRHCGSSQRVRCEAVLRAARRSSRRDPELLPTRRPQ